jgi:hypothetical protein
MEFLKKLPVIMRQHYEKVLLALALVALALSGFLLAQQKAKEGEDLQSYLAKTAKGKVSLYTNADWGAFYAALQKATNAVHLDFRQPRLHNLFGPVKWQRRPDGSLLKIEMGNEVGPEALKVTKLTPLYLIISISRVASSNSYQMYITREAATNVFQRKRGETYVTTGSKDRFGTFTLKEIKGTADEPELVLELSDTGEKATLFKDKPFQRVDGYKVDLTYPPENGTFNERRKNDIIRLGGEDYILVDISQNEVVLSARSNNKRTTLRYNAAR